MVGRRRKIKKKALAKTSYSNTPKKEIWTKIEMIQNLIFGINFLKKYFEHTMFLYLPTRYSGHHQSFFLISNFVAESLKANKN